MTFPGTKHDQDAADIVWVAESGLASALRLTTFEYSDN